MQAPPAGYGTLQMLSSGAIFPSYTIVTVGGLFSEQEDSIVLFRMHVIY
jgi:hypothetical protein